MRALGARPGPAAPPHGAALSAEVLHGLREAVRRAGPPLVQPPSEAAGSAAVRRLGRGLDLHDIRPWTPGDEARHLDRNATARRGAPFVRTFHDEREPRHVLVADFRPSMLFGTRRAFRSVAAAEALVLLGWRLAPSGVRIGGIALTAAGPRELRGGLGERAVGDLIAGLCGAHAEALAARDADDPPLDRALESCLPALPPGGTATLASALAVPGEGLPAILAGLGRRCRVRAIRVEDPFERAPPRGFYPYATTRVRGIAAVRGAGGAPGPDDPLAGTGVRAATVCTADEPGAMLAALGSLDDDRRR